MNARPFGLARTTIAVDFDTDRQLQQFHDADDADAAAEERGASIALERLTNHARWIGEHLGKTTGHEVSMFLVSFIGAMRPISLDLANAMAEGSGLDHLIEE